MQLSNDGKYWMVEKDGTTRVGLTEAFLTRLGAVWNLVPSPTENVEVGEVFAHVESCKCLLGLRSPIKGKVKFNVDILENPDKLTYHDALLEVTK